MAHLKSAEQIRAAGAAAVAGWDLSDAQVERLTALLMPVRDRLAAKNKEKAA